MKIKKRYMASIFFVFFILYFLTYVWILTSVKYTLKTVYLHPERVEQIEGIYVAPEVMNEFLGKEIYPSSSKDKIEFSLSTGGVLHFFFIGKVWIAYKYEGFDGESNKSQYGSAAPMRLTVKLSKGKWKIINKFERP